MSTSTVLIIEVIMALINMYRTAEDVKKIKKEDLIKEIDKVEAEVAKLDPSYLPRPGKE